MSKDKLSITFPEGFVSALNRRHNGAEHTEEEIGKTFSKLDFLYQKYKETKKKLDYCDNVYWEEAEIEKHFMESKWYYAHRKRKNLILALKELHKQMFITLTYFDGNGGESFSEFHCISAEEIYEDFKRKYMGRNINELCN